MDWSVQQDSALSTVAAWLNDDSALRNPVFRLFGYAGTGKTTLAKHFAADRNGVQFAAFTGKAASVMRSKGCVNATTIHSLIYRPRGKSGEYLRELETEVAGAEITPERLAIVQALIKEEKQNLKRPAFVLKPVEELEHVSLFILDEASMISEQMAHDLLSFDIPILVLGDPAQLPPVKGTGYFTDVPPDVMLTEIHRQAQDSPIIALATAVREGRHISRGRYGTSRVITKSELAPGEAMSHDQMLVGRNATRHKCNARARQLQGKDGALPVTGDRLVCLRNNHEIGLLNGEIWNTISSNVIDDDKLAMELGDDGGVPITIKVHRHHFENRAEELGHWDHMSAQEFDYGYALTVHKSQGSQWPSVILFDESSCFRADARRWLYTGITRAAERLTVVVG